MQSCGEAYNIYRLITTQDKKTVRVRVHARARVRARACLRVRVHARVRACVRVCARVHAYVHVRVSFRGCIRGHGRKRGHGLRRFVKVVVAGLPLVITVDTV